MSATRGDDDQERVFEKRMARSTTFDDRRLGANQSRAEQAAFQRLAQKSQSFVSGRSAAVAAAGLTRSRGASVGAPIEGKELRVSDVIYRRFFGMRGDDVKQIPTMNRNGFKLPVPVPAAGAPTASSDVLQSDGILSAAAAAAAEAMLAQLPPPPPAAADGDKDQQQQQERQQEQDQQLRREQRAVVVVDTFSSGAMLAYRLNQQGFQVICVLSGDLKHLLEMLPEGVEFQFAASFVFNTQIEEGAALSDLLAELAATGLRVEAVLAGAETGVHLTDLLSEALDLRTNGTALSEARRNKYVMGETVREAGLRAVKQLIAVSWVEIAAWLDDWQPDPFKVIVKPVDSAGSDDVTLCHSLGDVQRAFGNIMGKVNGLGIVNHAVLVQEFLEGTEYIVDMVSRDGHHKAIAVWEYDRRAVNGADFVCFSQRIMDADQPRVRELIAYQARVISALGIRNGPTHGEVKWCRGEPVLVEVGARCQGADALWLQPANECFGYNQVQASIDAYLFPERFAALPDLPTERKAYGGLKWLVIRTEGLLSELGEAALAEVHGLGSYRGHQIFVQEGKEVVPTKNCFTWGGCVVLANPSSDELESDFARLEELERGALFTIKPKSDYFDMKREIAVAVVDPFSTGAVLAADLRRRGYRIITVYSSNLDQLENLLGLVPEGLTLSFDGIVAFDPDLKTMCDQILAVGYPVVAIMAGTETGVELADQLSEALHLRTNGTALSTARRNKYAMGEAIRTSGLRAVEQLRAASWAEAQAWLEDWQPDPFKVIVKPVNSAGSDKVTLCSSMEEAKAAFEAIVGKVNGLGFVNEAALVQEYLEGPEYVVDMVSRDGVHKAVAIWVYDKRPVNGAEFVCFGQRLLTADEPHVPEILEYARKVATALGIRNGPTHGELKWFLDEPVLVEVGARCHGVEGAWQAVTGEVYGYDQVQVTIDAYMNPENFEALPMAPMTRQCYGRLKFFVLHQSGLLEELDEAMLEELQRMRSFVAMEITAKPGNEVSATVDCFTFGGVVKLVNNDLAELIEDYKRIEQMESGGLFKISAL